MYDNNLFVYLFSDTSPTDIYTLSLHDALPISSIARATGYLNEGKLALAAAEARKALESGEDRAEAANLLGIIRSEEHTSELQSPDQLVCRLLLEKKKRCSSRRPASRSVTRRCT